MGGWKAANWRPRGRGNFYSCSFTAIEKVSSIGREMEGKITDGGWGGETAGEMVECNGLNLSHIPVYAFENNDLPGYTSTPSHSKLINNKEFCNRKQAMA